LDCSGAATVAALGAGVGIVPLLERSISSNELVLWKTGLTPGPVAP